MPNRRSNVPDSRCFRTPERGPDRTGVPAWLILCGWWLAIGHVVTGLLLAIADDGRLPPDAVAVRTG
jgi:hypothetical protein